MDRPECESWVHGVRANDCAVCFGFVHHRTLSKPQAFISHPMQRMFFDRIGGLCCEAATLFGLVPIVGDIGH
jgi:hypothetical protein